ncbi:hypothetical protein MBM_04874 [Drepanopeziza brunnea f. sp. 'multigermtubi' MB_m1]|uniref:BTB domain-containing protein n=1 Tax=Marssonina brunnea f. sp. multigermtubi (strain MB_m1) TaxID=1072389 RepID=K1WXL8_MARBU|nr:uncharacterized protein MBM_04874 [Drepanopeziza brunnea f. sp. 'multigermtubi' MB_m1]EKD17297.1 hypothetical protein MBM_04874 [Drepanopeziza brunnea f. sp. 'multigermtubi' MB_m1]
MVITKDSGLDSKIPGTEIVKIYVGLEKKLFSIYKESICAKSDFFKKAFKGNLQQSNGVMYMPEEHISAFKTLMVFLY